MRTLGSIFRSYFGAQDLKRVPAPSKSKPRQREHAHYVGVITSEL